MCEFNTDKTTYWKSSSGTMCIATKKKPSVYPCDPLNTRSNQFSQKQWLADVLQNRCSSKFRNIHRITHVLESLSKNKNGVNSWRPATLLKKDSNTDVVLGILGHWDTSGGCTSLLREITWGIYANYESSGNIERF